MPRKKFEHSPDQTDFFADIFPPHTEYHLPKINHTALPEVSQKIINVKPSDMLAKKREHKIPIGKINISVKEIKYLIGLSEDQHETAISYLLLLTQMVNFGEILNTPEALKKALLKMEKLTVQVKPEFSPSITKYDEIETEFPLSLQIPLMEELLRGPFRAFEPEVTYVQLTFSEFYLYYLAWLQLLSNSTPQISLISEPSVDNIHTQRGQVLHKIDAYFHALMHIDKPELDVFPTKADYEAEFRYITEGWQLPLFYTGDEYVKQMREFHERIILEMEYLHLENIKKMPVQPEYDIWRDDRDDILASADLLSEHWIQKTLGNNQIRHASTGREVSSIILLGGNPNSANPLGISFNVTFDSVVTYDPQYVHSLNELGIPISHFMEDLKVGNGQLYSNGDPTQVEAGNREQILLRYLTQTLVHSYNFANGKLVQPKVLKSGEKSPYITKTDRFLGYQDTSFLTSLRLFNHQSGDSINLPIEMSPLELRWMNVWFTKVFIPWVHILRSVKFDLEKIYKLVS